MARRKPWRSSVLKPGLPGGDELAHVKVARNAGHRNESPWRSRRSLTDADKGEERAGVEQIVEDLGALIGALTLRYVALLRRPLLMA